MDPARRTSLIFGLFFAGTFVFSIPALLFYDPLLNDADYILGSGGETRISMGALFESCSPSATSQRQSSSFRSPVPVSRDTAPRPRARRRHRGSQHGGAVACRVPRLDVPDRGQALRWLRQRTPAWVSDVAIWTRPSPHGTPGSSWRAGRFRWSCAGSVRRTRAPERGVGRLSVCWRVVRQRFEGRALVREAARVCSP